MIAGLAISVSYLLFKFIEMRFIYIHCKNS